jgi:arabinofuranosyltransferase
MTSGPSGPGVPALRSRQPEAWVALATALLSLRVVASGSPYLLLDDAFISFRYAANLVAGHGLVFNPGERVEGYTNFLWTILLAACQWAGLDMPAMSVGLAFAVTLGTLVLLLALARQLLAGAPSWVVAAPALLFGVSAAATRYVLSGMETPLFVFLVTLGLYLAVARRHRPFVTGVVFALATMTRPEGGLYFGLAFSAALLAKPESSAPGTRRLMTAAALAGGFLLLYAPYFLWRLSYYGYLLPNTFYVKAAGDGSRLAARGLSQLPGIVRSASLEAPLLLALGALPAVWRDRRWRLLGAVLLATFAYFVGIGGDFLFFFGPRFLMPALPALLLLDAEALRALAAFPARRSYRTLLAAAVLALLLGNAVWFSWPARFDRLRDVSLLNRSWTEIGKWLRQNSPPGALVAVGAAGRIPYYSGRRTLDILGLTDLHIAHLDVPLGAGFPGHEKSDPEYVLSKKPDYIVFARLDPQGRPLMGNWDLVLPEFEEAYEMVALAKASESPGPWVLAARAYSPSLGQRGYRGAIFRRKALAAANEPASGS